MSSDQVNGETTIYAAAFTKRRAIGDLVDGFRRTDIWFGFAMRDMRLKFRRSVLGPLWITISTAMTIAALSLVYSTIFPTSLEQIIPYLTIGLVLWGYISGTLIEGCDTFIWPERWIKNVPTPLSVHWLRTITRNALAAAFNLLIVAVVLTVYPPKWNASSALAIVGLFLLIVNLIWVNLILGVVCARFRDLTPILTSLLQVTFFVTPIFWSTSMAGDRASFVEFNPLFHLIEVVRAPLLGGSASNLSWTVVAVMPLLGFVLAVKLYQYAHSKIAFWV